MTDESVEELPRVALTAVGTALARATETARDDALFEDPLAVWLAASGIAAKARMVPPAGTDPEVRGFWASLVESVAIRTRFFDDYLTESTRSGCRQVVLLGAGLDARAFRLRWPPRTTLFELDTGDIVDFKTRVLTEAKLKPSCQRVTVPIDLRDDWPTALANAGFRHEKASAWLAEGLLIYFTEKENDELLRRTGEASSAGSRLGVAHVSAEGLAEMRNETTSHAGHQQQYSALWRSGLREAPDAWLSRYGWRASVHDTREIARLYGRQLGASGFLSAWSWLMTASRLS
jgi:methyltransferase (TIGR00027 family)